MGLFFKEIELEKLWSGLIYSPKQLQEFTLDLTVKTIYSFDEKTKGALDFGGSEYRESKINPLKPEIEEGEKWGWWNLITGTYLVEYNEKIDKATDNTLTILLPHPRLLFTGCYQPTRIIPTSANVIQNLLVIGAQGLNIKQNARLSQAVCLRNQE